MMPMIGRSSWNSAISVPKVGRPVMKARVPSIGSSTQRIAASGRSRPNSSPRMPWSGNRSVSTARIACSAVRSAMVTGDRSAFWSVAIPARKNGRITAPATSAAAHAAAIRESVSGITSRGRCRRSGAGAARRCGAGAAPGRCGMPVQRRAPLPAPRWPRQRDRIRRQAAQIGDHVGPRLVVVDPGEGHPRALAHRPTACAATHSAHQRSTARSSPSGRRCN